MDDSPLKGKRAFVSDFSGVRAERRVGFSGDLSRNGSVNGRFVLERKKKAHLRRKLGQLNGLTATKRIVHVQL
jgi:hypothetical protein